MKRTINKVVALAVTLVAGPLLSEVGAAKEEEQRPATIQSLLGLWGSEQLLGPQVRGELTIDARQENWRATLAGFEVAVEHNGDVIKFMLPGKEGEFRGRLSSDRKKVSGHWIQTQGLIYQPGYATPIELAESAKSVWKGQVVPLDETLSLYLSIEMSKEGEAIALIRNPEFYYLGKRAYRLRLEGDSVTLSETRNRGELKGTFDPKADRLLIQFKELPQPISFTRRKPDAAVGFFPRSPTPAEYIYREPVRENDGWQTANLGEAGFDPKPISALVEKLLKTDPLAKPFSYIHSVLIARHGKLVLEEYFYGFTRERPHDMKSAAKSYAPLLVGIAIDRGAKISADTPVYSLFPENAPFANPDQRKDRLLVKHLMSMTTGYACNDDDDSSPGNENTMQNQETQPDWYKYTLDLPMASEPGTEQASYCSAGINLLGGVVRNATKTWLPEFFHENVGKPLQMDRYYLNLMPMGDGYAGGGYYLRPRDELKLCQLYLSGGVWNGRRVISKKWVDESLARHSVFQPIGNLDHEYGYGWHIHHLKVGDRTYRYCEAGGNGGQLVLIVPDLDIVVGVNGGNYGDFGTWSKWGPEILSDYVIPAVLSPKKE